LKDNPPTGTPTAAPQANDFTITSAGNVGFGITIPTTKVDIKSTTSEVRKNSIPNKILLIKSFTISSVYGLISVTFFWEEKD